MSDSVRHRRRVKRHGFVFANEREFQSWIAEIAEAEGWRVWHAPMPMRPAGKGRFVPDPRGAGLPDLFLIHEHPPRLIFAEVKVDAELSDRQREFLRLARQVAAVTATLDPVFVGHRTIGVYVWRPANRDLIETILRSKVMQ